MITSEDHARFKEKIKSFRFAVMLTSVFLLVTGGTIFGLGVETRSLLRITRKEQFLHVEWVLDLMVGAGLAQLATGGLDSIATCGKSIWPLYLAIGLSGINVFLNFAAMGTSLHLLHVADALPDEDIIHPWYSVECRLLDSCENAVMQYLYYYLMPQVALAAVAIFLESLGILTMGRMVRAIADEHKRIRAFKKSQEEAEEEDQELKKNTEANKKIANDDLEMTPIKDKVSPANGIESAPGEITETDVSASGFNNPNYQTPSSILKVDHGYIQASGGSFLDCDLNLEEDYEEIKKKALGPSPSIQFRTDVQVHYFDQNQAPSPSVQK